MRVQLIGAALLIAAASSAAAQTPADTLSPLQVSLGCAPPPMLAPKHVPEPRVVGAQDTGFRTLTGQGDLLVIDSGLRAGLALDQRFFVRRPSTLGDHIPGSKGDKTSKHGVMTLGWIRITAVNDIMAIATVEHSCSGMEKGDYLDPFVEPAVPEGADHTDATGELDFTYAGLGRIVFGSEDIRTAAAGSMMLADFGSEQGVTPGARYAIYRDAVGDRDSIQAKRAPGLPLAAVGEVIVMSTGSTMSIVRITASRDIVRRGDYLVPRK
jgi:hypothetical protein